MPAQAGPLKPPWVGLIRCPVARGELPAAGAGLPVPRTGPQPGLPARASCLSAKHVGELVNKSVRLHYPDSAASRGGALLSLFELEEQQVVKGGRAVQPFNFENKTEKKPNPKT